MFRIFYPHEYVKSVFSIDYQKLYAKGYRAVIFDIDNTLVPHGKGSTKKVDHLFKHIHSTGLKTLLLSNNDKERIESFIENIDTMYICDAQKPKTPAYFKALKMLDLPKESVVFVGDQLFTDIFGANRCGIDNILVAYIRKKNETKIGIRRNLEKIILRFYKHSRSCRHRLGDIHTKETPKHVME